MYDWSKKCFSYLNTGITKTLQTKIVLLLYNNKIRLLLEYISKVSMLLHNYCAVHIDITAQHSISIGLVA